MRKAHGSDLHCSIPYSTKVSTNTSSYYCRLWYNSWTYFHAEGSSTLPSTIMRKAHGSDLHCSIPYSTKVSTNTSSYYCRLWYNSWTYFHAEGSSTLPSTIMRKAHGSDLHCSIPYSTKVSTNTSSYYCRLWYNRQYSDLIKRTIFPDMSPHPSGRFMYISASSFARTKAYATSW